MKKVGIYIIIILVLLIILTFVWRNGKEKEEEYQTTIKEQNDTIKQLKIDNVVLSLNIKSHIDSIKEINTEVNFYKQYNKELLKQIYNFKKEYENKIRDISNIPVDSIYSELTKWLDYQ
jgi:translation initiation factor 2B subunit (eIF-2B alpha/beta/delta family)